MNRDHHFVVGAQHHDEQLRLPFPEHKRGISFLRHGARRFAAQQGRTFEDPGEVQSDPIFGTRVAQAYENAQVIPDHRVRRAYDAMRQETHAQFEYLTKPRTAGGLGMTVEFTDDDPYPHQRAALEDVQQNRRLKVYKTKPGEHPYFSHEDNDKFRAVHDLFGHLSIGSSFTRHGEEQAYRAHAQLYSDEARPALTTETRGQNAALIYGKNAGEFPEQKPVVLPPWTRKLPRR